MFIIVKHASDNVFKHYWQSDPKKSKQHFSHSVHSTFSGNMCDIQPFYNDRNKAEVDCDRINVANPTGGYAVCELDETTIASFYKGNKK